MAFGADPTEELAEDRLRVTVVSYVGSKKIEVNLSVSRSANFSKLSVCPPELG
jgi:hypothetical protein